MHGLKISMLQELWLSCEVPLLTAPCRTCCAPDAGCRVRSCTGSLLAAEPWAGPMGDRHFAVALPSCLSLVGKLVTRGARQRFFTPALNPRAHSTQACRFSQRGFPQWRESKCFPPLGGSHCDLGGLAQQGTLLPMTPTCKIQLAPAAASCQTTSGPGKLVREDLGSGEDGKTGRDQRRSATLCKPAFQSLPLSQKLPFTLLRQDAATFLPAPALPTSAAGQTRAASLPCKGRLSSPPLLRLPLLCRNLL